MNLEDKPQLVWACLSPTQRRTSSPTTCSLYKYICICSSVRLPPLWIVSLVSQFLYAIIISNRCANSSMPHCKLIWIRMEISNSQPVTSHRERRRSCQLSCSFTRVQWHDHLANRIWNKLAQRVNFHSACLRELGPFNISHCGARAHRIL